MSTTPFPVPLEMIEEYIQLRDSSLDPAVIASAVKIFTVVFTEYMGKEATGNELLQACLDHESFSEFPAQPKDFAGVVELALDYFEITGLFQ